jgi:hypothetical protein
MILAFSNIAFDNMKDVILHGGGWFVSCIMIHYILLYCIKEYLIDTPPPQGRRLT